MPLKPGPAAAPGSAARPRLSVVAPGGPGPDVLAFPGELALILRVALPLASHRQRLAAVGFAVEDLIAEPLDAVHVALGPEVGPGEYLAAVVRRGDMAAWAPRARAANRPLVPDVLALPVPPEGSWSVLEAAGRVLVRRADHTGFATRTDGLETFWRAAGAPQVVLFGGRLPDAVPAGATGLMPATRSDPAAGFDLLQGAYARRDAGLKGAALRLGAVAAAGLVLHGLVLAADTFALARIAADREATLRAELSAHLPDLPVSVPLDLALRRALPADAAVPQHGFLPLLSQVAEALEPHADAFSLRSLGFEAGTGSLSLLVEASDLSTLQDIEASLSGAGLAVAAGVATTGDGGAEVRYVLGGAGG